jgi:hypothetical protein
VRTRSTIPLSLASLAASLTASLAALLAGVAGASAAELDGKPNAPVINKDGSVQLAGRSLRCDKVGTRLDRNLPNLGAADLDRRLLLLNPSILGRFPGTVQLFVFHHECGHHKVGSSEIASDCWAIDRGARDGWLDRDGLGKVCRSFGNAPETDTHPSAKRRCAALDRCFAKVSAELSTSAPRPPVTPPLTAAKPNATPATTTAAGPAPKLVAGPQLLWRGQQAP